MLCLDSSGVEQWIEAPRVDGSNPSLDSMNHKVFSHFLVLISTCRCLKDPLGTTKCCILYTVDASASQDDWGGSSAGQSIGLSRQRSRVRAPSIPGFRLYLLSFFIVCVCTHSNV